MNRDDHPATITPAQLRDAMKDGGSLQVVDVRELSEINAEGVEGARPIPLSHFEQYAGKLAKGEPTYVFCRTGNRAQTAAEKLRAAGHTAVHVVDGGLEAWKEAGFATKLGSSKVWSLERQVRFAAGALVFLGTALAWILHPAWLALPGFIGAGLVFSAVSNTCGMAMCLARLPWNQR